MVSKVLMFHENTDLIPSGGCCDLSPCNDDTFEHITLVLVGIHVSNKLGWVEAATED